MALVGGGDGSVALEHGADRLVVLVADVMGPWHL